MGEYPKRSELKTISDDFGSYGTVVEIKTDTRNGFRENVDHWSNVGWSKNSVHFRVDENGNNIIIDQVVDILTNSETHPHGIKVELLTGDIGRVQRILTGEELKKYKIAASVERKRHPIFQLTEEEREYEQATKFFPKSEIPPPPETVLYEFKASFKTETEPHVPSGKIKDPKQLENTRKKMAENSEDRLTKMISNAVTALANTKGGKLFIGVNDDGKVVPEYFKKELNNDWDEYLRGISDSIKEFTGSASFLSKIEFQPGEDDEFLVIHVKPGAKPYYVRNKGGIKEFYMRGSGKSEVLSGDDLDDYKKERWPELYGSKKNTDRWNRDRRNYRR